MNFIRKVFHCSENKFFAVLFASVALLLTIAWLVYCIIAVGASFFTFTNVWNYFVLFLIYGCLLVYNIRNDNRAYTAISLLLFAAIIGSFIDVIYDLVSLFRAGWGSGSLLILPIMALDILIIVVAVFAFIQLNAYRIGRTSDYKRVRLWLILFAVVVVLPSVANYFIYLGIGEATTAWFVLVTALASEFASLCAAVSAIFTFNRLIR